MSAVASLVATGSYLPPIRVSNDVLRERFTALGKPDVVDKLEARSGIRCRWAAPDDWSTSDLAVRAAGRALERAGLGPESLDLVIVGTDSPDFITPATSVVVQHKLGATRAGTFDVGCACASFPTALATASGLIATNSSIRTVLVIGAYMMQRLADPDDPISFFYGDGAGAAVLVADRAPGFVGAAFQADGSYHRAWGIAAGGTVEPASIEAVQAGRTRVRMAEKYPPEINLDGWPRLVKRLIADCDLALDDVDHFIFTQVNRSTIAQVMDTLGAPVDKAPMIMDEVGYTGSACIPMALDSAVERGAIRPGDLVVMVGSGVGYNQAATAFRITELRGA